MRKLLLFLLLVPGIASAHEVYVLDPSTVENAMATLSPNPFAAYFGNELIFFFWAFVTFVAFSIVIAVSIFHIFEKRLDPILFAAKKYALPVARITVGLCFITFALTGKIYGSEISLAALFGSSAQLAQALIGGIGILATLGLYTRIAGIGMLAIYAILGAKLGTYILTYTDFLGAALLITILGGGKFSIDEHLMLPGSRFLSSTTRILRPYAFPITRVSFGWGVLFASVYAKFLHSQLALQVVLQYDLTRYFPFDPLFVVLGALIIEFMCGALLIAGIAIRWTLIFLAFWLTLSLLYFQELIWPHAILFGLAIALFLHGYDRYSIQGLMMKKHGNESVF